MHNCNKTIRTRTTTLIILAALTITGCKDKLFEKRTYMANVPVYMTYDQLRSSVTSEQPQNLVNPGKIYFKDNYLFVNEVNKGIHIIDNSNPSSPQNIAFINIPGNIDITIKENILYVDNYIDLVAIDLSNINDCKVTKRINDVFPYSIPEYDYSYPLAQIDETIGIVVGWKIEKTTEICQDADCGSYYPRWGLKNEAMTFGDMALTSYSSTGLSTRTTGAGGSMARFTIYSNYLYTINESDLLLFDITDPSNPLTSSTINIGWDIETLFPYNDKLFIGSQTGMFIYDLATPSDPSYISQFAHVRSCDPVVVEGNYAYVTLRSGNFCGGFSNQLDVIDISSLSNPLLIKSYQMSNPHGLGIDNNILFVCDGDDGLKVYSASDPSNIDQNMLGHFTDINAFDVIPYNNILIMIGEDGLYQYDYTNNNELTLLSVIPVN
ncbi:hypothetical protein JYU16_00460 [bacterium AH-315-M05]|nr:hypothetical protein [bacterium AH-315-M05]